MSVSSAATMAEVRVGQTFTTFSEFKELLDCRKNLYNEKLVVGKSSRTVKYANERTKGAAKYKEELVYTSVNMRCIHQGDFISRGHVRQSTSLKNGCPVHIKLLADKHTHTLRVTEVELKHSHVMPEKKDGVYVADRQLSNDERAEVRKLLDVGAPVANIQGHISAAFGKQVKCKDLHNFRAKQRKEGSDGLAIEGQVWKLLEEMKEKDPGAQFSVVAEESCVNILLFQTAHMRKMLKKYCDVLYIDCTYCLNVVGYPVVVFMVVDGNNVGHCVGYACVRDERMVTLTALFAEFVRKNEGLDVKTVVVDKDASEIGALRQAMPWCDVILCRFHVAKSLADAVRKYCVKGEQERMQELVSKMLWCSKEEDFWGAFEGVGEGHLKVYLQKNWLPVRASWANHLTKTKTTWGNKTNYFVERHNRVLKTLANSKTSLPELIRSLLAYHAREELKAKTQAKQLMLKSRVLRPLYPAAEEILTAACKKFTPYACDILKNQLDILHKQVVRYDPLEKCVVVEANGQQRCYSVDGGCGCLLFTEKGLPCWHMLAFFQAEGRDPLEAIPARYMKEMLLECIGSEGEAEVEVSNLGEVRQVTVVSKRAEKSEWEKGMLLKDVCRELVSVGVRCGMNEFEKRLRQVKDLVSQWRSGEQVGVADRLIFHDDMVQMQRMVEENGADVEEIEEEPIMQMEIVTEASDEFESQGLGCQVVNVTDCESLVKEIAEEPNLQIESALPHSGNGVVEVVTEDVTDCEPPANAEDEIVSDVANGNAGGAEGGFYVFGDGYRIVSRKEGNRNLKFENGKSKGRPRGAGVSFARVNRKGSGKGKLCRKEGKGSKKRMPNSSDADEEICGVCKEVELEKSRCQFGAIMDWIDCDVCHQWFHCHCVDIGNSVSEYICASCKAGSKRQRTG